MAIMKRQILVLIVGCYILIFGIMSGLIGPNPNPVDYFPHKIIILVMSKKENR
jgi:hypothetical protein